jgi:hypothetical protein
MTTNDPTDLPLLRRRLQRLRDTPLPAAADACIVCITKPADGGEDRKCSRCRDYGLPAPPTECIHCKRPADGLDGFCSRCRAEDACQDFVENLTNAMEPFLDTRFAPHRHGWPRPAYYLDRPDFENDTDLAEIQAGYDLIAAGAQKLIGLALGHPVEMWQNKLSYGFDAGQFMGISACFEYWDAEDEDPAPATDDTRPAR